MFTWGNIVGLTTLLATFSLEGHFTKVHDGRGDLVCILFLLQAESKCIKGGIGKFQFLVIINRIDFGFSLTSSEFELIIQYHKKYMQDYNPIMLECILLSPMSRIPVKQRSSHRYHLKVDTDL